MGPRTSPGGFNPAGPVGPSGACRIPLGPPPGRARPPPGALPPVRCAATGSGSARRPGVKVAPASAESFTAPHRPDFAVPGPRTCTSAPALPLGGGPGPPVPDAAVDRADCPQSVPDRAARQGGDGPRNGARGLRRSGSHPTRLETRTKESNAARVTGLSKPHGAMKVKAGSRCLGGIPRSGAGAPPARLAALSVRRSKSARVRTRKMVNYA